MGRLTAEHIPGFWMPPSAHMAEDISVLRNNRRVKEYDERLRFGKNEQNGDWCIFMLMPHGEAARPILGFGHEIPEEDAMMARLVKSDTLRHGQYMRDEINKENERVKKMNAWVHTDHVDHAAERVEIWHRQYGTHPAPRIFVPDSDNTEKVTNG